MAIGMLKVAKRAVNLATCEKGPLVCEDVTNCGGPFCGDCRLPAAAHLTVSFLGYSGTVAVNLNDPGGFFEAFVPTAALTLCNGTVADGFYLVGRILCDDCTRFGGLHPGIGIDVLVVWRNGAEGPPGHRAGVGFGDPFHRCGGSFSANTCTWAPDFDDCARPLFLDMTPGDHPSFFQCGQAPGSQCDDTPSGHPVRLIVTE